VPIFDREVSDSYLKAIQEEEDYVEAPEEAEKDKGDE
jgi:hypothetical protein